MAIISYSEALTTDALGQAYVNVQADLYNLHEAELNIMNDTQKLYDMQREYLEGKVDKAAVDKAQAELMKTKMDWYQKLMKYHYDSALLDPSSYYPYGPNAVDPAGRPVITYDPITNLPITSYSPIVRPVY